MKRPKIETQGQKEPLTANPFASLLSQGGTTDLPPGPPVPTTPVLSSPFQVGKTRKGGWPISVERRGNGWVTIVGNVQGDAESLLRRLRKHCASGGTARAGEIEIQGDHRNKVSAALDEWLPK
ncbi:MAG: hypothetical protein AMXMBFR84_35700 [Candidatus Hydrogenedentota bacterium]